MFGALIPRTARIARCPCQHGSRSMTPVRNRAGRVRWVRVGMAGAGRPTHSSLSVHSTGPPPAHGRFDTAHDTGVTVGAAVGVAVGAVVGASLCPEPESAVISTQTTAHTTDASAVERVPVPVRR